MALRAVSTNWIARPGSRPAYMTTQNTVVSSSSRSASRVVSTVTITEARSGATAMLCTVPITTFLYLSCDWPAVRPAAVWKLMVMVGPRLEKVSQASQTASSAVRTGTIHTNGTRRRLRNGAIGTVPAFCCVSICVTDLRASQALCWPVATVRLSLERSYAESATRAEEETDVGILLDHKDARMRRP